MDKSQLKERLKVFALRSMKLVDHLPRSVAGKVVANQLLRSSTSAAANYRSCLRARSSREFVAKMGIVLEELDESSFWLEFIQDGDLISRNSIQDIIKEADELAAIIFTARRSARRSLINVK